MRVNLVIRRGLEERVNALRAKGLSQREIAEELSSEIGEEVSENVIKTYLQIAARTTKSVFDKNGELQKKIIEAEIDTLSYRLKIIDGLMEVAENAERDLDKTQAYKVANEALDSYLKSIGKFAPASQINISNTNVVGKVEDMSDDELEEIIANALEV